MFIENIDNYNRKRLLCLDSGTGIELSNDGCTWYIYLRGFDITNTSIAQGTKNDMNALYEKLKKEWVGIDCIKVLKRE